MGDDGVMSSQFFKSAGAIAQHPQAYPPIASRTACSREILILRTRLAGFHDCEGSEFSDRLQPGQPLAFGDQAP